MLLKYFSKFDIVAIFKPDHIAFLSKIGCFIRYQLKLSQFRMLINLFSNEKNEPWHPEVLLTVAKMSK